MEMKSFLKKCLLTLVIFFIVVFELPCHLFPFLFYASLAKMQSEEKYELFGDYGNLPAHSPILPSVSYMYPLANYRLDGADYVFVLVDWTTGECLYTESEALMTFYRPHLLVLNPDISMTTYEYSMILYRNGEQIDYIDLHSDRLLGEDQIFWYEMMDMMNHSADYWNTMYELGIK